jgi:pimeloyl-ACP methyl ester carboxylesterase
MPVLALWGEADPLVPPAIGEALAKAVPHGQFHKLPGCGHLPTLEKPTESAALFASFLRENGLTGL